MAQIAAPTVHLFTREEYHRMGAAGLFATERVELLEGEVIQMTPKLTPHAFSVSRLNHGIMRRLDDSTIVRIQDPIVLDDLSEPEPDVVVCKPDPAGYLADHPGAGDILLVIEVADSSLNYDLKRKMAAYARAGIREYWVVNLVANRVHVFTDPSPKARRYRKERRVSAGDSLPLPGGATIPVAEFLPPA